MGVQTGLRESLSETPDEVHRCARIRDGGKEDGAMLDLEGGLHRSVEAYGCGSEETCRVATALVLTYNRLAMRKLSENNIKGALRLLQKAKLLTSRRQTFLGKGRLQARALTLNNTGCLMKKWGKPRESVKLLARALRIEAEVPGSADNPAGTHVNMSAALSTLGLHRAAAAHASHAIHLASQAMRQEDKTDSSSVTTVDCTSLDDCAGDTEPEVIDSGRARSSDVASACNGNGSRSGGGSGESVGGGGETRRSCTTTTAREIAESSCVQVPILDGSEAEAKFSAVADDGHSPEAPSLSSSTGDAGRGGLDHEKGEEREMGSSSYHESHMDIQRVPLEGNNNVAQGVCEKNESPTSTTSTAGALLAIAFFNLGVEREHLGQLDAALSSYQDARAAAIQHLHRDNPVARGIEVALDKASDAAVAFASESRKRSASRSRSAVSSFPSIGKLQFGYKTPSGQRRFDGRKLSPRRLQQLNGRQRGEEIPGVATGRGLLEQAYTSPRPCRPPPRTDSWALLGRVLTPRSPPMAPASTTVASGPQRSGRWTNVSTVAAVVPANRQHLPGGRELDARGGTDEELRWRALACAEWNCSPREAMEAQQTAE
ncbi:unnamed protein product, partial [Scytosiphon promiscuus]